MSQPQQHKQAQPSILAAQMSQEKTPIEQKWEQIPKFSACVWDRHSQESVSVNKMTVNEAATPSVPSFDFKRSISSKGKLSSSKSIMSSIQNKFSILKKSNPQISNLMKKITNQIKTQLLIGKKTSTQSLKNTSQTPNDSQMLPLPKEDFQIRSEILSDRQIVKDSCYRGLLKPTHIDNDVQSDDEDLNMGIRFMYGELLYSVGTEMVTQREQKQVNKKTKIIHKTLKKQEYDKQNVNHNAITTKANNKNEKQIHNNSNNFLRPSSYNSLIFQR